MVFDIILLTVDRNFIKKDHNIMQLDNNK